NVVLRCMCTTLGLICVVLGHISGHWEPEFLVFAWGFKYLFSASNTNKVINVIKCSFLDLFVDILFLCQGYRTILGVNLIPSFPPIENATLRIWRGSAKRSGPKSLLRCV